MISAQFRCQVCNIRLSLSLCQVKALTGVTSCIKWLPWPPMIPCWTVVVVVVVGGLCDVTEV